MAEPAPTARLPLPRRALRAAGRIIVRLYALLILLVVLWTGYTAISYLARYVFRPIAVPDKFLDPLAAPAPPDRRQARGSAGAEGPGDDLAHYHRDPQPFAFAAGAGCATGGCHTLMPHTKRKEVRAFANFHTTFLDCSSCHDPGVTPPARAAWLDNRTGAVQKPPALLRLMVLLEGVSQPVQTKAADITPQIIALLREAETAVGVDPPLHEMLIHLETTEPGSPVWRKAIGDLQAVLPSRVRGEYGARIAPAAVAEEWARRQSQSAALTREYNATAPSSPQRDAVNKRIHENVLAKPDACMTCHGGEPPRFDFEQLGYSPQRASALRNTEVARMIQHIREGRPFSYFSPLLQGPSRTAPPATRPSEETNERR